MNKIDKILVATDLSDETTPAVKAAALQAEKLGVELVVVHVLESLDERYDFLVEDIDERMREDATKALKEAMTTLEKNTKVKVSTKVVHGVPFEEIGKAMVEEKADLLVLGVKKDASEGYLGPVATKAAHKLPHDVLFVKGEPAPYSSIVAATDFSDCAGHALERSVELAKQWGIAKLPVVHAFTIPKAYYRTGHTEDEIRKEIKSHAKKHFDEWIGKLNTEGVEIEPVFAEGAAATAVCSEAKKRKADLVVVGTHGRTAAAAALIGNVAERIVRDASCDVWAERLEGQAVTFLAAITRVMGIE